MLGFGQLVAQANWNAANTESIRKAARDAGIELRMEDARHSQEKQVETLRSFVSQRVDVIAFSPVVQNGWRPCCARSVGGNPRDPHGSHHRDQ